MTIIEAMSQLISDKRGQVVSRFPCRTILVKNIEQYCDVLDKLHKIDGIEFISCGALCQSEDTMPQFQLLTEKEYKDRWVVVTGVSEYLRLYSANEVQSQRLGVLWHYQAEDAQKSTGRIIVPLWGVEQLWYSPELGFLSDLRQQDFTLNCISDADQEQLFECLILSDAFKADEVKELLQPREIFDNLKSWLDYWANPNPAKNRFAIITKRYANIQPTTGNITIQLVNTVFSLMVNTLSDGERLTEYECPKEAQELLIKNIEKGMTLEEAILRGLNAVSFNGPSQIARWQSMELGEKQLLWLWVMLHPDESYLYHCATTATAENLPGKILTEVFSYREAHPDWIEESQRLIRNLNMPKTESFFNFVSSIPIYAERIPFLTGGSQEERIYLIRMVGEWMRLDAQQVRDCTALENAYPELFAYLNHSGKVFDDELRAYFAKYKSYKLANTLPDDEKMYFAEFETEHYEARYAILADNVDDDCIILWIDALGAEWLPLLTWAIEKGCDGKMVEARICQANLPSETKYNDQWNQMTVPSTKKDGLDKLAHKGVIDDPDYYSCVEQQLSFIVNVVQGKGGINDLLKKYHRVIVTGDHGTSRLAARFFHERIGMPIPKGADVGSHGRFCTVDDEAIITTSENIAVAKGINHKKHVVFRNYDHYVQSGFATGTSAENPTYGEIHGGGTPEEVLVPVLVVDSKTIKPPKGDWVTNPVKISMRKVATNVKFSKAVYSLEVSTGSVMADVSRITDREWSVTFSNLSKGKYPITLKADGTLIEIADLEILSALGDDEDDLW